MTLGLTKTVQPGGCPPPALGWGKRVFITDFDGTMTRHGVVDLVRTRYANPVTDAAWSGYERRQLSHYDAVAAIFSQLRLNENDLAGFLAATGLDPALPAVFHLLHKQGWQVVVASAGCEWYIRKILEPHGLAPLVFANPGDYTEATGLRMAFPKPGNFVCRETGIDKVAIVNAALRSGAVVAYAGDGGPDWEPIQLVPPRLRFARGWLAGELKSQNIDFEEFANWDQIAFKVANGALA